MALGAKIQSLMVENKELEDKCQKLKGEGISAREELEGLKTSAQASTCKYEIIGAPTCNKNIEIHEPCKK